MPHGDGRRGGRRSAAAATAACFRLPPMPAHTRCITVQDSGSMLVGQEALDPVPRYQPARPSGEAAELQLRVSPADCFHSFKRLIGKK